MLARSDSRGSITLRSANVADPPVIRANYLESAVDIQRLVAAIKVARELAQSCHFDPFRSDEIAPGTHARSEAEIRAYIREAIGSLFHPVGTCKMGHDRMAVVDPRLRVYGVEGLRVADASIMPTIITGNTNAPAIMIGEKAADMIKGGVEEGDKLLSLVHN